MDIKLKVGGKFRIAMIVMIVIGIIAIVTGFFSGDAQRTWANLLLNNFYFPENVPSTINMINRFCPVKRGWGCMLSCLPTKEIVEESSNHNLF